MTKEIVDKYERETMSGFIQMILALKEMNNALDKLIKERESLLTETKDFFDHRADVKYYISKTVK